MSRKKSSSLRERALEIFKKHGGILKTSEALTAGVHPRILYELRDNGQIEQLALGVYGLAGLPGVEQPDFISIAKKIPEGVICLISALYFHKLTVQIPRWVDVAVRQKYIPPVIQYPPVQFHWFSDSVFAADIEMHDFGSSKIRIYSREKSIVDSFRLRRKVGTEVAIESLKNYWAQGNTDLEHLRLLAKASRVLRIMKPYVESIIHDQS